MFSTNHIRELCYSFVVVVVVIELIGVQFIMVIELIGVQFEIAEILQLQN